MMKNNSANRFRMVVIDKNRVGKGMCVEWNCDVDAVDFGSAVAEFFDSILIDVDFDVADRIGKKIFQKGFATYRNWHFEMLLV